jgi:hypothetical protein
VSTTIAPDGWELLQNYPNPFNPATRIGWRMKARGWVEVSVWNAVGQRIAIVVDGDREAGYHETTFGREHVSSGMPSGVYFYRIVVRSVSENFNATKAMVLAK